jgi:hypothetical protein
VRELEAEAATIAVLVAEGERQAEFERKQWETEQTKRRAEEAERRRVQNMKDSREQLFAIIESWAVAKQIEGFFEDAERRAPGLGEDERRRSWSGSDEPASCSATSMRSNVSVRGRRRTRGSQSHLRFARGQALRRPPSLPADSVISKTYAVGRRR